MDLSLNEQQQQLKDMIGRLVSERMAPRVRDLEEREEFPWDNFALLAEQGLMGILLPPQFGGAGADLTSFAIVAAALAGTCPVTAHAYITNVSTSVGILALGTDEQRGTYLRRLTEGRSLAVLSLTESGGGTNPMAIATTARADGDDWILDGTKLMVTATGEADVYVIFARSDPKPGPSSLTAFIVEKGTPGLTFGSMESKLGMRSLPTGELVLEGCRVPSRAVLGPVGGAMQVMGAISSVGALGAAAMGVGIAQAAVHHTRNQVLERAIAGQRLADNPVVLCQFADMLTETNAARALLHQAIWDKENSPPGPISTIFQAKVYATEVAQRVVDRAIQLHGMYGYSRELPLEKLWRDGRVLTIHFGTSDVLRAMASKVALGLFP